MHYRVRDKEKFAQNASPGLFCGYRMEAGIKFRGICHVLDYNAVKNKTGEFWRPKPVPEEELYIPEGEARFPLGCLAEAA